MSHFILRERLPPRTWAATVLTAGCIALIVSGDLREGTGGVLGDLMALAQAVFMAATFVLVRSRQEVDMVPCAAISGLLVACVSFPLSSGLGMAPDKILLLAILCFFILPVSFGLLIAAPKYIPAPEVNMILLLEMVLGPLLVWTVTGEPATRSTLIGGGLLMLVLLGHSSRALIVKDHS
jgi:drug/metabolite transporter (DMT)-like permease